MKEYRELIIANDLYSDNSYSVKIFKTVRVVQCYIFPAVHIIWVDEGQIFEVFAVPDFDGRYFMFSKYVFKLFAS